MAALVLCGSCSSSSRPPAGGLGTSTDAGTGAGNDAGRPNDGAASALPESGSGIGDDSGAPDSTPDDAASAPCNDAAAGGPAVSQVLVAGLRPTPLGGAIADGTYWLTESDVYAANWEGNPEAGLPPSAPVARTLVFSGTTVLQADAISTDAGPPSTVVSTSFYSVSGTILSETLSCPFAAGASTVTAYSVVGNDLWLFPQLYSREVYTRQ